MAGLLAAALAAAPGARAQTPTPTPRTPFTLGVQVELVSLTVVVFDKAGHFVSGLGPQDIQVYEDGVRQDVTLFQAVSDQTGEKIPLSVALVLDTSGSMEKNLHFLQEAARTFVYKLEPVDRVQLLQFNETLKSSAEFTGDVDRLERAIEGMQAWGGTALYDAVQYGLNLVREQSGRKAVVVFSDGEDTVSQMKEKDVIDYARAVEATVYAIGIRGGSGLAARGPRGFLRKIAKETGGAFFFPDDVGELIKIFDTISSELHHHYLLAYAPKRAPDGTWRKIEVKVDRPDTEVRVRKGYFAVKRR